MAGTKPGDLGGIKVGQYIVIDGIACKVMDYAHSKPGKHGGAKVRLVAMGIFEPVKKEHVGPASSSHITSYNVCYTKLLRIICKSKTH